MINKKICNEINCMGCGLCQNVCPVSCISMEYNKEGFLYPVKDSSKCIGCNLCEKMCISNHCLINGYESICLYSANSNDKDNLSKSSSGGIFGEACKSVINNYNGIVYGAVCEKPYSVKHMRALALQDTLPMHYSKYEQSNTSDTYVNVKKDLDENKFVLFTGTPCQVMALRTFLKKDYCNLLCIDVLCFGVMSSYVLRDYINYVLPNKKQAEGVSVCFRSKDIADNIPSFVIRKENDILHSERFYGSMSGLGRGFGAGFTNRNSCSNCQFQGLGRYSDITIGDYVKENSENDYTQSLVMINSEKGKIFFDKLDIFSTELSGKEKDFSLNRVCKKSPKNSKRNKFFKLYLKYGITDKTVAIWKMNPYGFNYKVKTKLKNTVFRIVRKSK